MECGCMRHNYASTILYWHHTVRRRCPDIGKMKKLGYNPRIQLDEGLKNTIAWYLENPEPHTNGKLL